MNNNNFLVVAIGASSGSVDSLTRLLAGVDVTLPVAFVFFLRAHRDRYAGLIARLQNETPLPITIAQAGERLNSGVFYLVPPGIQIEQQIQRRFCASPGLSDNPSVDGFFSALAHEIGPKVVGIILAGDGIDGVAGINRIFEAGGLTIAQRPGSAPNDTLSQAAIASGGAMYVMAPEEIAEWLPAMLTSLACGEQQRVTPGHVGALLGLLRERMVTDFPGDKLGAIHRCVRRRQQLNGCENAGEYFEWIQSHPLELEALSRDVFASVSTFYRDPHAFAVLSGHLEKLCKLKKPGDDIRIWVPGCASGEEAYSIAMLLAEILPDRKNYRIQIFATDIDENELAVARRGIFSDKSIQCIPPLLRERYFFAVGDAFEVVKTLRDMIVFARHNLDADLPFLYLDLVSCRKTLLYLEPHHQRRLLQSFHFALRPGGMLFVGYKLESMDVDSLFIGVDRSANIYVRASHNIDTAANSTEPRTGSTPCPSVLPSVNRPEKPGKIQSSWRKH